MQTTRILAIFTSVCFALASGQALAKKAGAGSKADYRSAKTGKYVKKSDAEKNKDTTVREERKKN